MYCLDVYTFLYFYESMNFLNEQSYCYRYEYNREYLQLYYLYLYYLNAEHFVQQKN